MKKKYLKTNFTFINVELGNPIADSYEGSWAEQCSNRNREDEDKDEDKDDDED